MAISLTGLNYFKNLGQGVNVTVRSKYAIFSGFELGSYLSYTNQKNMFCTLY